MRYTPVITRRAAYVRRAFRSFMMRNFMASTPNWQFGCPYKFKAMNLEQAQATGVLRFAKEQ